ncbi:MAG: hypothetical protein RLZ62_906, partial [Bacteroidota bacterium]
MKMSAINIKIYRLRTVIILFVPVLLSGRLSAQTVTKQLYLSDGLTLDRVDPVASGDVTVAQTSDLLKNIVSLVASANGITTNNGEIGGSKSIPITINSGTNRLLLVNITSKVNPSDSVRTVLFDGTPLTKLKSISGGISRAEVWYLINPTTSSSARNVVVNW